MCRDKLINKKYVYNKKSFYKEKKMNGRTILEKLKSRKLWAAVVGVAVGLAAAFGLDESEYTQIAGIVASAASVIAYIFGEAKIDAAASVPIVLPEIKEDDTDGEESAEE